MTTTTPVSFLNLLAATPPTAVLNLQAVQQSAVAAEDVSALKAQLFQQHVGGRTAFYDRLSSLENLLQKKGRKKGGLNDEKFVAGKARNSLKPPLRMDAQIAAAAVLVNRALKEDDGAIPGDTHEFLYVLGEGDVGAALNDSTFNVLTIVSPTGPLGTSSFVQLMVDLAADARNGSDLKETANSALGGLRLIAKPEKVSSGVADALETAAKIYSGSLRPLTAARLFFLAALAESWELFEGETDRVVSQYGSARQRTAVGGRAWGDFDRQIVRKAGFLDDAADALEACSIPRRPKKKYSAEIIALRKAAVRIMPRIVDGKYVNTVITLLAKAQESIAESLEPEPTQTSQSPQILLSARYYLAAAANWINYGQWQRGMEPLKEAVGFLRFLGILNWPQS